MNSHRIPLSASGLYKPLMKDYVEGHPQLRPFYSYTPSLTAFADVIESRSRYPFHRDELADELILQHKEYFSRFPLLESRINALRANHTFTVTTGHQLCIGTGPLFFIYKIITTINLCKELKNSCPDYNFVPVYWMASEDHDIDEINHLYLFNERLKWESHQTGCCGRLNTNGIASLIDAIEKLCGDAPFTTEVISMLKRAYVSKNNLAEATRELVLTLFGDYGLLVLDADRPSLKKLFAPVIREELSLNPSFEIVNHTTSLLEKHYKTQLNPREINLFYTDDQLRERIIREEGGQYAVVNTDLRFSHEFILDLVERFPDRFSPNVVLRPLYQECILPNLAYVGGPGEIAYWLQLKDLFEHYQLSYPMLVPRNHAVILPSRQVEKFFKSGFAPTDLLKTFDEMSKEWISHQGDLFGELRDSRLKLEEVYAALARLFVATDSTLSSSVQGELQKVLNGLDNLEKKGTAALKRKNEIFLKQVRTLTDSVNPGNEPQERRLNILQFYAYHGKSFIRELLNELKPFSNEFVVLTD